MPLDESSFHIIAGKTIDALAEAIDAELGDDLDVEIEGEILTLDLADGGQYIVNKNAPLRQIWLSSPQSGAWHFAWDSEDECWRSTRGAPIDLTDLLADELEAVTGTHISF
ncbi:iron donor protein CyaY [Telmatospirillum sp.]|uniref:iron donor protein CyaY n=1 Tax=Telmatospirillum sp. TaxID=2079197 RepID=UPI00284200C3|nr:iron donor protein CyaY [Telmatospirillum sp.]MDR3438000.1 iron donor protein CyaY [Telmatospirillum sp.]